MKRLVIFILVFFIAYLMGAFYSVSFNIAEWTEESRGYTLLGGGALGFVTAIVPDLDDLF